MDEWNPPNERRTESTREGADPFCPPYGPNAMEGRLVFTTSCLGETVRLHARLDHVDGVDDGPQLE